MSDQTTIYAHPARVLQRASSAELLATATARHAADPSIFDESPPFFFAAEISSNRMDAYFTRMAPTSLRNYAADAQTGVSFQDSHNWRQLGFGRSLTGQYQEQGDGLAIVTADFYTVPGLRLNNVSTDDLIRGIRAGLISDVSIGFYGGQFRCSICGNDMLDWWGDCYHVPGVEYEQRDAAGNVTGKVLAFAWVEDARLSEVSAVYDGATPGAAILKAQHEADNGRLRPETARLLEARYRIKLPGARPTHRGVELPTPTTQEVEMNDQHEERTAPAAETPTLHGDSTLQAIRALLPQEGDPVAHVRTLVADAADGRAYRSDLVEQAIAQGVRAYGAGWDVATYRSLVEAAPLATIKRMRDDWQTLGDKQFAGGRQTIQTDERDHQPDTAPTETRQAAPDRAYQA